jgi:hypothetical protein
MASKPVAVPVEFEKIVKYSEKKKPTIKREKAKRATIPTLLNNGFIFERADTLPSIKNDIPADIEENNPNAELRISNMFSVL